MIRNNWAYYLAEKVKASSEKDLDEKDKATDEEKAVALSLADYVEHKIVVVPNRAEDFSETVTFVRTHVRQGTNTKQAHA